MNPAHDFAAAVIARLGMSSTDRLILGAALVCDAVQELKVKPGSVFANVPIDEDEPFKTAIAALSVLDNSAPETALVSPENSNGNR